MFTIQIPTVVRYSDPHCKSVYKSFDLDILVFQIWEMVNEYIIIDPMVPNRSNVAEPILDTLKLIKRRQIKRDSIERRITVFPTENGCISSSSQVVRDFPKSNLKTNMDKY